MRNLALISSSTVSFENLDVSATTIDLDENIVYAASEKQSFDGEVDVELWKVGKIGTAGLEGVSLSLHRVNFSSLTSFARILNL